jgi:LacI family transcriptional regulator
MNKRQITLSDLAQELGISTATVSRALKDYPDISVETKRKVLELAQRWNYRPNSMAAGLRKRESKVIGVIIPSIVNHFFSSVITGIMQVAYDRDYRVMVCQSDESYEKEVTDAYALFSSRVDGLLVSLAHETDRYHHFDEFWDAGVPVVFFDKIPPEAGQFSTVVVDDYGGAYRAITHLIEQGYRRIAHLRGPVFAYTSRNRLNGYRQALTDHGLPIDESLIYACESISFEEGQQFARQIIQDQPTCDAIFCVTDTVAMGAMVAIKDAQRQIPQDLAVVGFSNWHMSTIIDPPLTSVAQPSQEMGQLATQLLLQEIQANKQDIPFAHQNIILPTELMIRPSSQAVSRLTI